MGFTDGFTSLDGMRQTSPSDEIQMSLSDQVEEDKNVQLAKERESKDVSGIFWTNFEIVERNISKI